MIKTIKVQLLLAIIIVFMVSACSAKQHIPPTRQFSSVMDENGVEGRLLVKSGSINVEVEEISKLDDDVQKIAQSKGGHVISSSLDANNKYRAIIRIPTKQLNETIDEIAGLGKEVSRGVRSSDVTEQFADSEADLLNLITLRDKMRELLAKATSVEEIMQVEKELNRIQTRIDSINRRLNSLTSNIELSRVSVSATQQRIYGPLGYLGITAWWVIEKLFVIK